MRLEWIRRMTESLEWIERRLEESFAIEDVARAAFTSPFHYQRMFFMVTGMTVAEYVRKRRLTLAAQELAMSPVKVVDVALKYGYDSPESFAKAFRKIHGISPSEARQPGAKLKAFPRLSFHLSLRGDKDMDYKIVDKDAFVVAGKAYRTTCAGGENSREIPTFWAASNADGTVKRLAGLSTDGNVLGVIADMTPGSDEFTYLIAAEIEDAARAQGQDGFVTRTIPAATWAVFTSVGPLPGAIQDVFRRIYQEWFPATGYEHAAGAELEVYPAGDTASADYRCEVWVPIVKK